MSLGGSVPWSASRGGLRGGRTAAHRFFYRRRPQGGGSHVDECDAGRAVDDRRHADDRPILGSAVELLERPSGTRHLRHPYLDQHLVNGERSLEESSEEIERGDLPSAVGPLSHQRAPQGQDGGGKIRCRITVGQACHRACPGDALGDHQPGGRYTRAEGPAPSATPTSRGRGGAPGRRWRSHHHAPRCTKDREPFRCRSSTDGDGKSQLHQWQERMAAGNQLGLVAVLDQQGDRFFR